MVFNIVIFLVAIRLTMALLIWLNYFTFFWLFKFMKLFFIIQPFSYIKLEKAHIIGFVTKNPSNVELITKNYSLFIKVMAFNKNYLFL